MRVGVVEGVMREVEGLSKKINVQKMQMGREQWNPRVRVQVGERCAYGQGN